MAPPAEVTIDAPAVVPDDRAEIGEGDKVVLIVEDDAKFSQILTEIAHEKGFKVITTSSGEGALALARQFTPDAVTLDIRLPDIDGWTVLDRMKLDSALRHIPVHIITVEEERVRGLERGAFAYIEKQVSKASIEKAFVSIKEFIGREKKSLLVIEDDEVERKSIVELIGNFDVAITTAATGDEGWKQLQLKKFDCIVLDLMLPDMSGVDILERMQRSDDLRTIPVIVHTAKDLTRREETQLKKLARDVIIKGVRSPEHLLDETSLFLHRVIAKLPEQKKKILEQLYQADTALAGKKILIVDDDVRNIFALTSLLERHKVNILSAENGKIGIDTLAKTEGIDCVLMDIMMPEMDGYETMRLIRKNPKHKSLPIIALTAKAMKGDREKCIEAGASDYITKPVNTNQLLSLLRVWLYKK